MDNDLHGKDLFEDRWPAQRARIDALWLRALGALMIESEFYGEGPRCQSDRGPDFERVAGALACGVTDADLDRLLNRIQGLSATVDVLSAFPAPSTPAAQLELLLGVVDDLIDAAEALLDPWLGPAVRVPPLGST